MTNYKIGKKSRRIKILHKNRIDQMHILSLKSLQTQTSLIRNYSFDYNDIRCTAFGRIAVILDSRRVSYLLISEFQNKVLSQKKYRNRLFDSVLPVYGDIVNVYENSINDLKRGYFLDLFQTFESTLRLLNISLGYNNGSKLHQILVNILNKTGLPQNERDRAIQLLSFISTVRNTVHNNGIYFTVHNTANNNLSMVYKGNNYTFVTNQKVEIKFSLLFDVTEDIIDILYLIIKDNSLNSFVVTSTPFKNVLVEDKSI